MVLMAVKATSHDIVSGRSSIHATRNAIGGLPTGLSGGRNAIGGLTIGLRPGADRDSQAPDWQGTGQTAGLLWARRVRDRSDG